jgi:ribose 5-phosphate isomerase B
MSVNKHSAVRSALCWNREIAALAVHHNDANVIALPARFISTEEALACVAAFIHERFEGGRHQRRVDKIPGC